MLIPMSLAIRSLYRFLGQILAAPLSCQRTAVVPNDILFTSLTTKEKPSFIYAPRLLFRCQGQPTVVQSVFLWCRRKWTAKNFTKKSFVHKRDLSVCSIYWRRVFSEVSPIHIRFLTLRFCTIMFTWPGLVIVLWKRVQVTDHKNIDNV